MSRPTIEEAVDLLLRNEPALFRLTTETLFRVVKNIETYPAEARYRELSTSSATYTAKIAGAKGGVRFLRALGFELKTVKGSSSVTEKPEQHEAMVLAAPNAQTLAEGKQALKAAVKKYDAKQEAARVAENAAAALKLKELQVLSQQNNQKITEQTRAERERIKQKMLADKFELERQRDPTNFK